MNKRSPNFIIGPIIILFSGLLGTLYGRYQTGDFNWNLLSFFITVAIGTAILLSIIYALMSRKKDKRK